MQQDLEAYLKLYHTKRSHRGRGMKGRTPEKVVLAGLPQPSTPDAKEVAEAA
jgi:hypothetical protein